MVFHSIFLKECQFGIEQVIVNGSSACLLIDACDGLLAKFIAVWLKQVSTLCFYSGHAHLQYIFVFGIVNAVHIDNRIFVCGYFYHTLFVLDK